MKTLHKVGITVLSGTVCAFLISWTQGLFSAQTSRDVIRILSDGFFVSGALIFAYGALVWTSNGGVWDGLLYSTKLFFGRIRRDFEETRPSFGEYQEQRREKGHSPITALVSGSLLLIAAIVFLAIYSYMS